MSARCEQVDSRKPGVVDELLKCISVNCRTPKRHFHSRVNSHSCFAVKLSGPSTPLLHAGPALITNGPDQPRISYPRRSFEIYEDHARGKFYRNAWGRPPSTESDLCSSHLWLTFQTTTLTCLQGPLMNATAGTLQGINARLEREARVFTYNDMASQKAWAVVAGVGPGT